MCIGRFEPTISPANGQHQQRDADKRDEGPVGNGASQEGPIDFGAVATAFEDHGHKALQRKVLDHAVEVTAT